MKEQNAEDNHMWRDIISKEELKKLYLDDGLGIATIGKLFGCSESVIKLRLTLWDIPKRGYEGQLKIDKENGIFKNMNKHLIVPGSKKRNRKEYLQIAKDHLIWKCSICDKGNTNDNFSLIVHHRDKNNKNNVLDNLQILCQNCHSKVHAKMRRHIINCFVCGSQFEGNFNQKYCSDKCSGKQHYITQSKNPLHRQKNINNSRMWRLKNENNRNKEN